MNFYKNILIVLIACLSMKANLGADIIKTLLFSDKSYARSIETHAWITTAAQVSEAFTKQEDPMQLPYRELHGKYIYLVVRLKNLEAYFADGTLEITCPGIGNFSIGGICLDPKLDQYEYYVIPLGNTVFGQNELDNKPQFSFKWKKLYVQ